MISIRHIFLPLILVFSLAAQLSLPFLLMKASQTGFNAAPYICNVAGRAPTSEAQAHIQALLKLASKDVPTENTPSTKHCSACITPHMAVISLTGPQPLKQFTYSRKASFPKTRPEIYHFAQGPPLGSRAPPAFS